MMGTSKSAILARCRAPMDCTAVVRVEHLITLVRWTAFEALISSRGLSAREARRIVGIKDVANFRRQQGRAAYLRA